MKGWRTLILSGVTTALGVAQGMDWTHLLPGQAGWIMSGIGILAAVLRTQTDTPVGKSS